MKMIKIFTMFYDRKEAAGLLAGALDKYRGENVIVAGIPRGGIETAYYVARQLQVSMALIIVKKLAYPRNPEFAFGAMAEDGTVYYNQVDKIHISQELIDEVEDNVYEEIERRKRIFRNVQVFPNVKGRTVIIVDDGIATGATIFAAIGMCRKRRAAKIVVASPVCAKQTVVQLQHEADEVIALESPERFKAVSQYYESFNNLTDEEALAFVEKWEKKMA